MLANYPKLIRRGHQVFTDRIMRTHGLMLVRSSTWPRRSRRHKGRVAVDTSNQRWCSDGFEFRCDNGDAARGTFALDCCD